MDDMIRWTRQQLDGDGRAIRHAIRTEEPGVSGRDLEVVELHKRIVDAYERYLESRARHRAEGVRIEEDVAREERGEPVVGHLDVRIRAFRREADYLDAMEPELRGFAVALAAIYRDRDGYKEEWSA